MTHSAQVSVEGFGIVIYARVRINFRIYIKIVCIFTVSGLEYLCTTQEIIEI